METKKFGVNKHWETNLYTETKHFKMKHCWYIAMIPQAITGSFVTTGGCVTSAVCSEVWTNSSFPHETSTTEILSLVMWEIWSYSAGGKAQCSCLQDPKFWNCLSFRVQNYNHYHQYRVWGRKKVLSSKCFSLLMKESRKTI